MKNILWKAISITLLIFCIYLTSLTPIPNKLKTVFGIKNKDDFSAHWLDMKSQYEELNCNNKIVFLGNSITEYGNWEELLQRDDVVNRGISGDISKGVLLRSTFYASQKPKSVFLKIGINDLRNGIDVDTIRMNIMKTIKIFSQNNVPIVIQSIFPIGKEYQTTPFISNKIIKQLNIKIKSDCDSLGIKFIDLNKVMTKDGYLNPEYTTDNIHLNGKGYIAWSMELKKYL